MEQGLAFACKIAGEVCEPFANNDSRCFQMFQPYLRVNKFYASPATEPTTPIEIDIAKADAVVEIAMTAAA